MIATGIGLTAGAGDALGVSVFFGADFFPDSAGDGIPNGALVQLVVSTDNDTFGVPSAGSFVGEPDDLVLVQTSVDNFFGFFNDGTANGFLANRGFDAVFDAGDRLLFRWWPTLDETDVSPGGNGVEFGQYRPLDDSTVTDGSDHPFVVPASESATIILRMSVDFMGNLNNPGGDVALGDVQFGTSGGVVIPEPGRVVLALLGGGVAILMRRRTRTRTRAET